MHEPESSISWRPPTEYRLCGPPRVWALSTALFHSWYWKEPDHHALVGEFDRSKASKGEGWLEHSAARVLRLHTYSNNLPSSFHQSTITLPNFSIKYFYWPPLIYHQSPITVLIIAINLPSNSHHHHINIPSAPRTSRKTSHQTSYTFSILTAMEMERPFSLHTTQNRRGMGEACSS